MQEKFNIKFYNSVRKFLKGSIKLIYNPIVTGLENIPDKPYILVGNHISMIDVALLISAIDDDIHFMAKKELFENKMLKEIFEKMGAFPVDRQVSDVKAFKTALKILRSNQVLGIFPEGTRNKTDEILLPFKEGASQLASRTKSVIVPFGISGKYNIRSKIRLNIGEPIYISSISSNQTEYLEEQVKRLILKKD